MNSSGEEVVGCRSNLLGDDPSSLDHFSREGSDGPHLRLAKAIAEVVSSEAGGRLLSLEGKWGSGKSTVVTILQGILENESSTRTFKFDAWAHSGDPLRLIFLQTLFDNLKECGWIPQSSVKEWTKRLQFLSGKSRETVTKSRPRVTALGAVFALSILFVPVGTTVLGQTYDEVSFAGGSAHWPFLFALLLTLAPVLVGVIGALLNVVFKFESGLAILSGKTIEDSIVNETTTAGEPTSVQFEAEFRGLMDLALANPGRRLVLIVDNLDRARGQDISSIWGSLQAFTEIGASKRDSWHDRFWVVIPFDPDEILRLWPGAAPSSGLADTASLGVSINSLLDKTFQARFELPLPVSSDWQGLCLALLKAALPEHISDEFALAVQVFAIHLQNRSPSPRDLKAAVNHVSAIHRQWPGHEFPIPHVAYFVLLRRDRVNVCEKLLTPNGIDKRMEVLLGEGLYQSLSALAFNVDRSRGIEVLLTQPIIASLSDGNSEALGNLIRANPAGFWSAMPAIYSRFAEADSILLGKMICAIASCQELSSFPSHLALMESVLLAALRNVRVWENATQDLGSALANLLNRSNRIDGRAVVERVIRATIIEGELAISDRQSVEVEALQFACAFGDAIRVGIGIPPVFQHGRSPQQWLRNLSEVENLKGSATAALLEPLLPEKEIVDFLKGRVAAGSFEGLVSGIEALSPRIDQSWNSLADTLWKSIAQDSNLFSLILIVSALSALQKSQAERELSDEEISDRKQAVVTLWANPIPTSAADFCIDSFLLLLSEYSGFAEGGGAETGLAAARKNVTSFFSHSEGEIPDALLRSLKHRSLVSKFLEFDASRGTWDPVTVAILKRLICEPDGNGPAIIRHVIRCWSDEMREIISDVGWDKLESLSSANFDDRQLSDLSSRDFSIDELDIYALLRNSKEWPKVRNLAETGISSLEKEQWTALLGSRTTLDRLIAFRDSSGGRLALPGSILDALSERIAFAIKGNSSLDSVIRDAASLLDSTMAKELGSKIAGFLCQHRPIPSRFLESFPPTPEIASALVDRPDSDEFYRDVFASRNVASIEWLGAAYQGSRSRVRKRFNGSTFEVRLKDAIGAETDQDVRAALESVLNKRS